MAVMMGNPYAVPKDGVASDTAASKETGLISLFVKSFVR